MVDSQAQLDAAFADMEHLLADGRVDLKQLYSCCVGCGRSEFVYNGPAGGESGSGVCTNCGHVQQTHVFWETMCNFRIPTKSSNYKRIHHWHERISQLLLLESQIPNHEMQLIVQRIKEEQVSVLSKDSIRAILRSLNMQQYIEKWLQVIFRMTGIGPPTPGPLLIKKLDELFIELQQPFDAYKGEVRKFFLNYNYVFHRLFQQLNCPQFCMFFPLIKSRSKLKHLENMWQQMSRSVGWIYTPMTQVAVFSVKIDPCSLLTFHQVSAPVAPVVAATQIAPWKTGYRRLDLPRSKYWTMKKLPPHSIRPAPTFQRLGVLKKRRHCTLEARFQSPNQQQSLKQHG